MHTTVQVDPRANSVAEALRTLTLPDPAPPLPRAKLIDRLALRVGLALLLWSARTQQSSIDPTEHSRVLHSERERQHREHAAQRRALLAPVH